MQIQRQNVIYNPSQFTGAPYGTNPGNGPNGTNCCEDLRDNYLSYGLSYQQFKELETKYQCDGNNVLVRHSDSK